MLTTENKSATYTLQGENKGTLTFNYLPCVNYAIYNNNIPICLECTLTNEDNHDWNDICISLEGTDIIKSQVHINEISSGKEIAVTELKINPDTNQLITLTEAVNAPFKLTISINGNPVFEKDFSIYLMAFDQWCGSNIMPELLATFVTPNQPLLSRVINNAAKHLQKFSGSSSFDEYQTQNPNRVRMQVAALFEALREEGLIYVSCPASFENYGQRIRLADKVLNEKLGTCLDLTLLYASCLESVGIHPILVLKDGHIFLGAWLVDSIYSTPVSDDISFLVKESSDGMNEMVFIESTCLTSSSSISFDKASDIARHSLLEDDDFNLFIDVARCRMDKIRPLPQRVNENGNWTIVNDGNSHKLATDKVQEYSHYDIKIEEDSQEVTKQQLWERKLLDFSLRNNLLNMKIGKKVIPFISFQIDKLEDYIQGGKHYQLLPNPMSKTVQVDETGIYHSMLYKNELEEFITKELTDKKLHSYLKDSELDEGVKHLYRESRTALEENGANSLFLVLGILKWYETPQSERPRFAPLLLLPVEIVRNGGCKKFVLRARDEEIILNITLAELLKQKYDILLSGLNPLPKDESGVDVKKIFSIIRKCILHQKGWDVIEECMLGLFSFNKFVMWNDIHANAEKLKENLVVQSLMNNQLAWQAEDIGIDTRELDSVTSPEDYALPVPADSSQLEAVLEAGEGKSFILHGPPGTGKSQTITNIIANALYHGKKVLFVAEKMAALSVVQNRLARIGLEPFCLELHSNKINKKHFLEQMDQTLSITRLASPQEFSEKASLLFEQRKGLIAYMENLHRIQECGYSLYDCINGYTTIDDKELIHTWDDSSKLTKSNIEHYQEQIQELDTIFDIIGQPDQHPLYGLYTKAYSVETKEALNKLLPRLKQLIESLEKVSQLTEKLIGCQFLFTEKGANSEEILALLEFYDSLSKLPRCNPEIIDFTSEEKNIEKTRQIIQVGQERNQLKNEILNLCSREFLNENSFLLLKEWENIQQKWFLPKFFATRNFLKRLRLYAPSLTKEQITPLLTQFNEWQHKKQQVEENLLGLIFDNIAKSNEEDWDAISLILSETPRLMHAVGILANHQQTDSHTIINQLFQHAGAQWSLFKKLNETQLKEAIEILEELNETHSSLLQYACLETGDASRDYPTQQQLKAWIQNLDRLRDWQLWCTRKAQMEAEGLGFAVQTILTEPCTPQKVAQRVTKGIFHQLAQQIIDSHEELNQFNGLIFEKQIEKYRRLAAEFQELTKKELYCRLASKIPSMSMEASASSELGILKKNINNGGRGTSIRKIMDLTPTLLPQLCPCMLMSPLSVAQYIDLDQNKFDLVIFDEASQMPTSEAVGAIARGKSLIVVGDPKQMPPTSFFSSNKVEEEEAYIDDLDSILDDCIALSIPSRYLTWHYRSKHESLIAFSNSQYYDGKLYTFPSTDDRSSKVTLISVEGTYDKGRTRSNVSEARAIVQEVLRRLADEELSKYSIGIIAFSSVQQNLIEDLLTDALAKDIALETKAYEGEEPIFIKNLENVQGDERDVILFSIGYGPDKNGKVSMNFGPLNNKGGERRLNVAVSRARYEMMIFSTLKSEQIDLKRTKASGVEGLKRFLEFAERGTLSVPVSQRKKEDSLGITNDIARELKKRGYQVDTSVGRSNFKVDLAIVSPEDSTKYLLGILCDGKNFFKTNTMRDREIVQPSVLNMLHWNIFRVWAIDWFEHKETVLDKIESAIKEAQSKVETPVVPITEKKIMTFKDELRQAVSIEIVNEKEQQYQFAHLPLEDESYTIDEVLDSSEEVEEQISQLIEIEQPITNSLLYKRIVKIWRLNRTTPRIQKLIDGILEQYYTDGDDLNNTKTYWKDAESAVGYETYRINSSRDILDIPIIEIANAMVYTIEQQISVPVEDFKRLTSQVLGFSHFGRNIDVATEKALSVLVEKGVLCITNRMVTKAIEK